MCQFDVVEDGTKSSCHFRRAQPFKGYAYISLCVTTGGRHHLTMSFEQQILPLLKQG